MIKDANVTIQVKDMNRSITFYEGLGFSLKSRWSNHYAQLSAPGITIGLHPAGEMGPDGFQGHISIGFTTQDLETVRAVLTSMHVKFEERQEEGGDFIRFADPDGTALYFINPKW